MTQRNGSVPIDVIDREIAVGFRTLLFAPVLEERYEADRRDERARYFIATGQLATVLYDLFLFSDWQMTPDVFFASCVVRLGIFTPLFLVVWYIFRRTKTMWVHELIAGGFATVSVILIMTVLTMSRAPDLASYQYGTVLIMLFATMVQRLRFRYTISTIGCILVVQFTAICHLHGVSNQMIASAITFYLTAGTLLAWANYTLERGERRGYLLELRGRFLNDHLDYVAKHDALTELWNRRHLDTVMGAAWSAAEINPKTMSVILLDIDHFKSFNDSHGHLKGDDCLRRVAACVAGAANKDPGITGVRFGGEEFLVFIDGSNPTTARLVAERIQASIRRMAIPHPMIGDGAIVTASFGIATGRAPLLAVDRLVAAADEALYKAKRAGRDRIWPTVLRTETVSQSPEFDLSVAC